MLLQWLLLVKAVGKVIWRNFDEILPPYIVKSLSLDENFNLKLEKNSRCCPWSTRRGSRNLR